MPNENTLLSLTSCGRIERARAVEIHENGMILVETGEAPAQRVLCDFLQTTDAPAVTLMPNDTVLVLLPSSLDERGCVLGRIGAYCRPEHADELVIEAKKSLTLHCGESMMSMRSDGKLLLKGVDVVSRAKRNNKIKGGSVHIN